MIAEKLGKSVEWCRKNIKLPEFAGWVHRINEERQREADEATEPDRRDYYLMQIAMEVKLLRYAHAGIRDRLSLKDFILKPEEKGNKSEEELDIQARTQVASAAVISRISNNGVQAQVPDFKAWQQQLMKSS